MYFPALIATCMKVLSNTSVLFCLNNLYGLHYLFLMAHVSAAVFLLSIKIMVMLMHSSSFDSHFTGGRTR